MKKSSKSDAQFRWYRLKRPFFSQKPYNVTTSNVFFYLKMAKTAKTSIYLDTTLPLNDSKQLSQVSDQVLDKSDVQFRRKWPKTWFLSENGQILDQKRVQKWPRFFCRNKNFHWPILNNKINKKSITVWKQMAKNSPKPYNVITSSVFLTQKCPKPPKQQFF